MAIPPLKALALKPRSLALWLIPLELPLTPASSFDFLYLGRGFCRLFLAASWPLAVDLWLAPPPSCPFSGRSFLSTELHCSTRYKFQ